MNPDVKLYRLNENEKVDKYLNDQLDIVLNRLINLGHSKEIAISIIGFDRNDKDLRLLTAEIDSNLVGIICYSEDSSASLITINLVKADSQKYENFLYSSLEKLSREQDFLYIKEILSLKDIERIEKLKNIGFTQEFICFFKRV